MDWVIENQEWLFSGVGIFIISILAKVLWPNRDRETGNHQETSNIQNENNGSLQATNNGTNNTQIFNLGGIPVPAQEPSNDSHLDMSLLKSKTRILFIDDNDFPVVRNLKQAGWITDLVNDVHDIDDPSILASHILFVDINGVAKNLSKEEGIGLVKALKQKYGSSKKVIIYSSDEDGNRFNQAFRLADDFLPKQSDYFEFLAIVEKYSREIFGN
ncbi:hypothetical protein [Acinetobacter baumannii]|uniref:hypothetical protein n=1 Tax=Acinetobacter baumannii TaxID=470 RepID=UPI0038600168